MQVPGFRGVSAKRFIKGLYKNYSEVGVADSAAQVSYYLLFSLFPFLFFLVTLTAYLPMGGVVQDLIQRAGGIVPDEALDMVQKHLNDLIHRPRPKLLTLGLVVSIYSASRGVDAMRGALNRAYKVVESRPFWKTQGMSILMTSVLTLLVMVSFGAMILGGKLGFWAFDKFHAAPDFVFIWSLLRWPITALIVATAAAISYYVLPDVEQKFEFITPGSIAASLFWLLGTWGFTVYTDHFNTYNVTYGSIGSVIILLTWFYLSALVFLVGGVMNVVIEHESAEVGKAPGARREGEPTAPLETRLISQVPGASKTASTGSRLKEALFSRRRKPHPS